MNLPQLNAVKYEVSLPVSKRTVEVRPWLISEEKALLIAKESEKPEEIAYAVLNILKQCTFDEDIEHMPIADVEWILLNAKAYSSGEMTNLLLRCQRKGDDGEKCSGTTPVEIDLQKEANIDDFKFDFDKTVKLTDTISVTLKSPNFGIFKKLLTSDSFAENTFQTIASAIDYITDDDEVIKNFTLDDAIKFIESMNEKQLKDVTAVLNKFPKLMVSHDYKCSKCGKKNNFKVRNFFNFFMS